MLVLFFFLQLVVSKCGDEVCQKCHAECRLIGRIHLSDFGNFRAISATIFVDLSQMRSEGFPLIVGCGGAARCCTLLCRPCRVPSSHRTRPSPRMNRPVHWNSIVCFSSLYCRMGGALQIAVALFAAALMVSCVICGNGVAWLQFRALAAPCLVSASRIKTIRNMCRTDVFCCARFPPCTGADAHTCPFFH